MAWAFMGKTEPTLRARAMRFLARREHSRAELQRKLSRLAAEGEDIEALLDELARRGWLSDARFAEQRIRSRSRRFGPLKLAQELRSKGIGDETVREAFRAVGAEGAADIGAVWRSRFRQAPGNDRERARQVRFLQARGFALDDILRFLRPRPS